MKFSIFNVSFLFAVLWLTHIMCPRSSLDQSSLMKDSVVAAYFTGWNVYSQNPYNIDNIYPIARQLTHLLYAFVAVDGNTTRCVLDSWADLGIRQGEKREEGGNFQHLLELKKRFPHIKILLSIGGGKSHKAFSQVVKAGKIKQLAQSCVEILDHYEYVYEDGQTGKKVSKLYEYPGLFDGVDIDWEWTGSRVPEEEAKAYGAFLYLIRVYLDKRDEKRNNRSLLTSAIQVHPAIFNALSLERVQSSVDWFHFMTYDYAGSWSKITELNAPLHNPASILSIVNSVESFLQTGVPAKKIVLGLPLYGQVFDKTKGLGKSFVKTSITKPMSYKKIKDKYLQNDACYYDWHQHGSVPYLYCPQEKIFISFDDERSIEQKAAYVKKMGLGGVFFWSLGLDDADHSLVKSLQGLL